MTHPLIDLAVAGLVNDQATTILVESDIAEPVRGLIGRILPEPYSDVVKCRLCSGMWIALGQAVLGSARQALDLQQAPPVKIRRLALFLMRALAIAGAGRLSHNLTRDYLSPNEPDA